MDCAYAIEELEQAQSALYETAFDHVVTQYENILDVLEYNRSIIDEAINQAELSGKLVNTQYYSALIAQEQKTLSQLQQEKASLTTALNNAVNSGTIDKGSEAWYEMCQQIDDVTLAIEEAESAILEYYNDIRDVEWSVFDLLQSQITNIITEADFLIDLLSEQDLIDDSGQFTSAGLSTLALYASNYETYMEQAQKYAEEIADLDKEIAKDPYNTDLADRREELLELQQEAILAAYEERDAIVSLVEDAIEAELDALQDLIDEYTSALDSAYDLFQYQKKISDQTAEIASLQKQIAAYSGDTSESAKATVQKLQVELADAEEELQETIYEQYISDQKELLNNLYDEYELLLNQRLDDLDALLESIESLVSANSGTVSETIYETADSVGYTITDSTSSIIDGLSDLSSAVTGAISTLTNLVANYISSVDSSAISGTSITGLASGAYNVRTAKAYFTQEEGLEAIIRPSDGAILTPLARGDSVLNADATAALFDFANNPTDFLYDNLGVTEVPSIPIVSQDSTITAGDISMSISLPNVTNYSDFKYALQHDKDLESMLRSMTTDKLFGGSSLKKYKY